MIIRDTNGRGIGDGVLYEALKESLEGKELKRVEQEFLSERRFTRIRVRDDRKGAATQDFLLFGVV